MTTEQCLRYSANYRMEVYLTYVLPAVVVLLLGTLAYNRWFK
jgi:hypothetical protein